jgi:acyl carrier protein
MSLSPDAEISKEALFERVKAIFLNHLKIGEPSLIRLESDLQEDLGVKSLDLVDLIIAVEEEFQIRVESSFSDIKTVDDVLQYLMTKMQS